MTRVERISRLDSRLTGRSRAGFRQRVRALRYDRVGLDALLNAVEHQLRLLIGAQHRLPSSETEARELGPEDASCAFLARHGVSEDEWWVQYANEIGAHPPWVRPVGSAVRCRDCRHVVLNEHSPDVGVCGCRIGHVGEFARKRHTCADFVLASAGATDGRESGHGAALNVPASAVCHEAA